MATSRLLGRTTASTGAAEEITVGAGLSLSSTALTAKIRTVDIPLTYTSFSTAATSNIIDTGITIPTGAVVLFAGVAINVSATFTGGLIGSYDFRCGDSGDSSTLIGGGSPLDVLTATGVQASDLAANGAYVWPGGTVRARAVADANLNTATTGALNLRITYYEP